MVRVATRIEGAPAVAAVPEPTRERKSKGENDRETGESTGESPAIGLPIASAEKVGEKAGGGLVLSAPRRLAREKVRWKKAAPTRLRLVACWSASGISSSLVGCAERISCGLGVCEEAQAQVNEENRFHRHLQPPSTGPDTGSCRMAGSTNNRNAGTKQSDHGISKTRLPFAEQFRKHETPAPTPLPRGRETRGKP